jgi:hypothetical protein
LLGDKAPVDVLELVPAPTSDPLVEAAELGTPPALAELREYIDDTDIRFELISDNDGVGRSASGSEECLVSSAMVAGGNFGVSQSSTAQSSLFVALVGLAPGLPTSAVPGLRRL